MSLSVMLQFPSLIMDQLKSTRGIIWKTRDAAHAEFNSRTQMSEPYDDLQTTEHEDSAQVL
jgi:hypothetical protein